MLRVRIRNRHRNMPKAMGHGSGPEGRINRLRLMVTALVRHERIEGPAQYIMEAQPYVEKLIQDAQRYGDKHKPMMDMADYWLEEKDLIHKLFKVLVPRYNNTQTSVSKYFNLPTEYPGGGKPLGLLELKGNPWPPVVPKTRDLKGTLINVLLDEAKRDYRQKKYEEFEKRLKSESVPKTDNVSTSESQTNNDVGTSEMNTDEKSKSKEQGDLGTPV